MQKLKSILRITLNTLFALYTFWHIGFTYIILYILQNYVLHGLPEDITEISLCIDAFVACFLLGFSMIISGACFTFRKKAFGTTYLTVFLVGCVFFSLICFGSVAVLPKMPEWFIDLISSVFIIETLPYPSLFISVALIVTVSLIILYVVVSHIVDRHKKSEEKPL